MPLLEIACFNAESALVAQEAGANRIELCREQALGGTTPLLSTFRSLKRVLSIPIYVMIRPHGRDFSYCDEEFRVMEQNLETFKAEGVQGFVFGMLNKDGKVDQQRCRDLVLKAEGRPCTFHRAFDEILEHEMEEQLDVLVECGFRAVLTSGGKKNAVEGQETLKRLVAAANGRLEVIVGGGVRSSNVEVLKRETSANIFHSSAIVDVEAGEIASRDEIKQLERYINA
jgi:copper homeostasis protein